MQVEFSVRILTFVEVNLEGGLRMWRRQGIQVYGEGRPVTLPPIIRVTEPGYCYYLRGRVFLHLHLPRVLQVRWVVVYISHIQLVGEQTHGERLDAANSQGLWSYWLNNHIPA